MMSKRKNSKLFAALCGFVVLGVAIAYFIPKQEQSAATESFAQIEQQQNSMPLMEIPVYTEKRNGMRATHIGYTVDFNPDWHIPNWVAYELTSEELVGDQPRATDFTPDPAFGNDSPTTHDYTESGFDRGHMAPAGDMKWSEQAMNESFYTSNICPQNHNLNKGDWNDLEQKVRYWARKHGRIYVVTGPIVSPQHQTIGETLVAVPDAFFKVLLCKIHGQWQAVGFVCKNKKGHRDLATYCKTIDEVEALTGMDFFSNLEDNIENKIEGAYDIDAWGL